MPVKRSSKNISIIEMLISKLILLLIAAVFGVFTLIGYNINVLFGAIFMSLFMGVITIIIDLPAIKNWIDENIDSRNWDGK